MEKSCKGHASFYLQSTLYSSFKNANKSESYVEKIYICNWIISLLYVCFHVCISHTDKWDLFAYIHDAI